MEKSNQQWTHLCLIKNFGCTRSGDDEISLEIRYHCFVDNCAFETANLGELIGHFDNHKEKWTGFCHACNVRVDSKARLLFEISHWDKCHRSDNKNGLGIYLFVDAKDKRAKLQEAVRVQRFRGESIASVFDYKERGRECVTSVPHLIDVECHSEKDSNISQIGFDQMVHQTRLDGLDRRCERRSRNEQLAVRENVKKAIKSRNDLKMISTNKGTEPTVTDLFRYRCAYCPQNFQNPKQVYDHWATNHNKPNGSFMFQLEKIFQCARCRHVGTDADLKKSHWAQKHSKETFAMIDKATGKRLSAESPIEPLARYLTDEWLEKIIAKETTVRTDQIMYCCPTCPSARCNDQWEMVDHIRKHFLQFQCDTCGIRVDDIEMLKQHRTIVHTADDGKSGLSLNENLDKYSTMKIIFPNGLVLTKEECANTKFGAMDEVIQTVKKMNAIDLAAAQKRLIEGQGEAPLTKPKVKKSKIELERSALKSNRIGSRSNRVAIKVDHTKIIRRGRHGVEQENDSPPVTTKHNQRKKKK